MVLSDGEPNQHPKDGEEVALRNFIEQNPLSASLSMFGYGYSLNTKLLSIISELGGGSFSYIPDCSMIGTVFVNFLSLALSSFSSKLQINFSKGNSKPKYFNLGPIQYGVTKNFLLKFKEN